MTVGESGVAEGDDLTGPVEGDDLTEVGAIDGEGEVDELAKEEDFGWFGCFL